MIKSMVYTNSKTYWNIQDNEKIYIYTSIKVDLIDHKHSKSKVSCVQKLCLSVSTAKNWWILRSQVKCIFWWNDETYSTMNWNC